jgi:hypothetical protein
VICHECRDRLGLLADADQVLALAKRGVPLGLSGPQLTMVSLAAGTLVLGLYAGVVMTTFPVILVFVALGFVSIGGRKILKWGRRSALDMALHRRSISEPPTCRQAAPAGHPGTTRRLGPPTSVARPRDRAVVCHDPHAATLTAIVGVSHPAFALLNPAEPECPVVSWGRVLATGCRSGCIASL